MALLRRRPEPRPRPATAIAASGERIDVTNKAQIRKLRSRREAWQEEAWAYFDEIPELKFAVRFKAAAISKLRLYPAWQEDPDKPPIALDAVLDQLAEEAAESSETEAAEDAGTLPDAATDLPVVDEQLIVDSKSELFRLRAPVGGQPEILRCMSMNLEVPGEFYLVGMAARTEDGTVIKGDVASAEPQTVGTDETWDVLSIDEIKPEDDGLKIVETAGQYGGVKITVDDFAARMWLRHPRQRVMADSSLRGVLGACETLLIADRTIRATLKSRTSAGMLLMPDELSFGDDDPTEDEGGDPNKDPFEEELAEALTMPVLDEGSASAVVPMKITGPAEYLKEVRQVDLGRKLDQELLSAREKEIVRIGNGLDLPIEVVTGMAQANHWTAWQIDDSMFRNHIEPQAVAICDFLTSVYLRPALLKLGHPPEEVEHIVCWYDPSPVITRANAVEDAKYLHTNNALSDAAMRAVGGFDESDAPDEGELERRMLNHVRTFDPMLVRYLLQLAFGPDFQPPPPMEAGGAGGAGDGQIGTESGQEQAGAEGPPPQENAPGASTGQGPKVPMSAMPQTFDLEAVVAAAVQGALAAGRPHTNGHARPKASRLGRRLASLDHSLMSRLVGAADAAMAKALDRAGAKLVTRTRNRKGGAHSALLAQIDKQRVPLAEVAATFGRGQVNAAGFTEEQLLDGSFDDFGRQFLTWSRETQDRAVQVLVDDGVIDDEQAAELTARMSSDRDRAWEWLAGALAAAGASRLYNPAPVQPEGGAPVSSLVPTSMIREAMARAGGATNLERTAAGGLVVDQGARPAPLTAMAEGIRDAALAAGFEERGYLWQHDDPLRPFPPHENLDGTEFSNFGDDVLLSVDDWIGLYYFPGDHDGCLCIAVPQLVATVGDSEAADMEGASV